MQAKATRPFPELPLAGPAPLLFWVSVCAYVFLRRDVAHVEPIRLAFLFVTVFLVVLAGQNLYRMRAIRFQQAKLSFWGKLSEDLACFLGSGYSPVAPGTVGTLAALPLASFLSNLALPLKISLLALLLVVSWLVTARYLKDHPGNLDPKEVVIDEVVGICLTACFLPARNRWLIAAFVAFRFFDIVKPWPIRTVDRKVKNAAGVILDDLIAGLFALACILGAKALLDWSGFGLHDLRQLLD